MGALAGIVGVLFVRAVERAERVHLAMQARGFAGTPPVATSPPVERRDVLVAAILAAAGVCLLVAFR